MTLPDLDALREGALVAALDHGGTPTSRESDAIDGAIAPVG